jgi:hypothetical protein
VHATSRDPPLSEFAFIRKTRGIYRFKATLLSHLRQEASPGKAAFDWCLLPASPSVSLRPSR